MKHCDPPIDHDTGKSILDPSVLAQGTCWDEYNNDPTPGRCVGPLGWKIMRAAGFVWRPQSAGYERYYVNGLNAVDGAMSVGLGDGRVCVHIHPTVGRGDKNDDGDYRYICSVGSVEWPAYLTAPELAVFVALVDEDFRAQMAASQWRIENVPIARLEAEERR
jgi:hypothetical protein